MGRNPQLDESFRDATLWKAEAERLRKVLLECDLEETLKWGKPCYHNAGRNICIIQRMKGFLALMFFKGGLLQDPDGVLEVQGPNSRAGFRMRFTSVADVDRLAEAVRSCVSDAIAVEDSGRRLAPAGDPEYPEELVDAFHSDDELRSAFEALTPGRQRGYLLHFSGAAQSKTRVARIARARLQILAGKGLNER